MTPPSPTATAIPNRASARRWPRAIPEPRNRLYGTTVVPISPSAMTPDPAGSVGIAMPTITSPGAGAAMIAVTRKLAPITATIAPSRRATSRPEPKYSSSPARALTASMIPSDSTSIRSAAPAALPSRLPAW